MAPPCGSTSPHPRHWCPLSTTTSLCRWTTLQWFRARRAGVWMSFNGGDMLIPVDVTEAPGSLICATFVECAHSYSGCKLNAEGAACDDFYEASVLKALGTPGLLIWSQTRAFRTVSEEKKKFGDQLCHLQCNSRLPLPQSKGVRPGLEDPGVLPWSSLSPSQQLPQMNHARGLCRRKRQSASR